jgi:hypothetical protein
VIGPGTFTLRYSYSHDCNQGHLVKSRAYENHITYNRLSSETSPTSYEIDLPDGGLSYVIGNVVQQGPNDVNSTFLSYMWESGNNPITGSLS